MMSEIGMKDACQIENLVREHAFYQEECSKFCHFLFKLTQWSHAIPDDLVKEATELYENHTGETIESVINET